MATKTDDAKTDEAKAAEAKATPATGTMTISEDRLAELLDRAAKKATDAAIARMNVLSGARPTAEEDKHEHADATQAAIEGPCDHPLSAHEYFGPDGYGRCFVDGCKCSGRELGLAAVTKANAAAKSKTKEKVAA